MVTDVPDVTKSTHLPEPLSAPRPQVIAFASWIFGGMRGFCQIGGQPAKNQIAINRKIDIFFALFT
jgi:hypothetical protein